MRRDIPASYIYCKSGAKEYLEKVKVVVNIFAWNDRFRRENRECEVFWKLVRSFEPDWPNVERYRVKLLYLERTQHHNPFFLTQYHNNNNTVSYFIIQLIVVFDLFLFDLAIIQLCFDLLEKAKVNFPVY